MTKKKIARICSIENCEGLHEAKGLCNKHYMRFRKFGDPLANHTLLRSKCTVDNCERWHIGHGYCGMHLRRWKLYGDPKLHHMRMGRGETRFERLWSKIDKTAGLGKDGDCWEWRGQQNRGYGSCHFEGKMWAVHRLIYFLSTQKTPQLSVLHSCDNPLCVNPDHLSEGTPAQNSAEMVERNRQAKGERNNNAKLTDDTVRFIRTAYQQGCRVADMAEQFGVAIQTLYAAIYRKTWRHVT